MIIRPPRSFGLIGITLFGALLVACGGERTDLAPSSTSVGAITTPLSAPTSTPQTSPRIAGEAGIVDVFFLDPSHGWILRGAGGRGAVFVTEDGGATWTRQFTSAFAPRRIQFVDADHGYLAGCAVPVGLNDVCERQLLVTEDGGTTWLPAATPPATQGRIVSIAFTDAKSGWVLADACASACGTQAAAQLSSTQDGGATWTTVPVPGGIASPVALQRLDERVGWVLTTDNVLRTRDGGTTWTDAQNPCRNSGRITVLPGQMTFVDDRVGWIGCLIPTGAGMTAGALYRSDDGGAGWRPVALTPYSNTAPPAGVGLIPTGIEQLDFLNEQDGWFACGCPSSGVWRTQDGGRQWQRVDFGASGVSHIRFIDEGHGWAWGATLFNTTDGGAHWQEVQLPP